MTSFESIARNAYEAFCKRLDPPDRQIPRASWKELPEDTQQAWIAAAQKMAEEISMAH